MGYVILKAPLKLKGRKKSLAMSVIDGRHFIKPGGLDSQDQLLKPVEIIHRRDRLFETVEIFSSVKTNILTVSGSRVSMETTSRQIETPRLRFHVNFFKG